MSPAPPTSDLVRSYLPTWETLEKYKFQEESLGLLFQKFCRENRDIVHVLLKVSALNDFYSTNIFDTHSVAKHIVAANIDDRLSYGDCSLVNRLAAVRIGNKPRNLYSFASKYCNHHYPDQFPVYDSYVEKMLWHFQKHRPYASFTRTDLKQYNRFVEVVRAFQHAYALCGFSLREIDIYL